MMHELPPQVTGTPELVALRDYLVRLARSLDQVSRDAIIVANKAVDQKQKDTVKSIQNEAASLKALIVKNANEIYSYTDRKVEEYGSLYVAKSDFGNYYEQIESKVETTARGTIESYHYTDAIENLNSYMTELNGQIRRGLIEDPDTHEVNLGIAISENLRFTGQTQDVGGDTYYELEGGQTLGLYTSTGWQFWINGHKRGWFSSEDSMLHVANIIVENKLQAGADWEISVSGGFGLKYIGG